MTLWTQNQTNRRLMKRTCKVKAVMIIEKAREPVSRRLKSRSILIPIIQAIITHEGTWNSIFKVWIIYVYTLCITIYNITTLVTTNIEICVAEPMATPREISCTEWKILKTFSNQLWSDYLRTRDETSIYQFILESENDWTSMFSCISNYWQQNYADKANRYTPWIWSSLWFNSIRFNFKFNNLINKSIYENRTQTSMVPTTYSDNTAITAVIPTNQLNPLQNPITGFSSSTSSSSS